LEVFRGYILRAFLLTRVRSFDLVIIEKELFPFVPPIAERMLRLLGVRYVVDYDDALFHRYDCHDNWFIRFFLGKKIDTIMRLADCVIAGNNYLAKRAYTAGATNVEIIPTVVDCERYQPKPKLSSTKMIVGWIGTPQTSHYLIPLLPVFEAVKNEIPVRFVAIGAKEEDFSGTSVEVWSWREELEVELIQKLDIGIMPLPDSFWEQGKCGYKLIQYMACGLPLIASPVGVNKEIVSPGKNGLLADSSCEWYEGLRSLLLMDKQILNEEGQYGRRLVVSWYSLRAQAPRMVEIFNRLLR